MITTFHYSAAHKSPENAAFLKSFAATNPNGGRPNFMAVAAYDGMAAIYEVARKLNGKIDGDKAMEAAKSFKFASPRGPISIDPETRDIVMNEYLAEVVKGKDGKLHQKVLGKIDNVKDPCKEQKVGPCAPKS